MNPNELKRIFPNASKSLLAANPPVRGDVAAEAELHAPEPAQPPTTLATASSGEAQGAVRPLIRFTLLRTKLLDWDAKHGVIKNILDGIVSAGLLHGDREDQLHPESCITQEKVKTLKEQCTLIEIIYP
jgi:hypothetical protein